MADVKITGIDNVLDMLRKLPGEVVSKRGGPVRKALRKGAKVIAVKEVELLRAGLDADLTTGELEKSVIVSRGKAPADGKGERFLVRVKRKTYKDRKGKPVTTLQTAQLKEYGSEKQPAEPFIVPAFKAKAREAIDVATKSLAADVDKIAQRLLK